jgi:hypothetical protein
MPDKRPTDHQIKEWKKEHGQVFEIDIDGRTIILAKPSRQVAGLAMAKSRTNPLAMVEVVVENCTLWGSDDILEDAGALISLQAHIDEIFQTATVSLKKL